jgi:hypothetical protein
MDDLFSLSWIEFIVTAYYTVYIASLEIHIHVSLFPFLIVIKIWYILLETTFAYSTVNIASLEIHIHVSVSPFLIVIKIWYILLYSRRICITYYVQQLESLFLINHV